MFHTEQGMESAKKAPAGELPRDLFSEKALIGCLLLDGGSFDEITDLSLTKADFFHPQYGMIFETIKDLHFASSPIDFITVCSRLSDSGKLEQVGGQEFILNITEEQGSAVNVHQYAKNIKDKSILRDIVRTATKIIEKGTSFNGDTEEFIAEVESSFFKLTSETKRGGLKNLKSFLKQNLRDLEDESRNPGEMSGLPTGFGELDKKLLGMQAGQLIILAARPAMGKTSLALNIAVNTCKSTELPVAVFSLEMLSNELSMRILSSHASIDSGRLRTKNFLDTDLRRMADAVRELSSLPIFINDSADVTILDIRSQCRKIKAEHGLGLVIIDYLQLMSSHTKNPSREQQISEMSRGLKNLAKEMECPVIALSQLNRAVESRVDKRPGLADLRESGSIEQDADIVLFVYRDEVYNPNTKEPGIAEVIVSKNRAGETGSAKLSWIGAQTRFGNLEYHREPQ